MREPAFWYRPASWKSHLLKPLAALYGAVAAHRLKRKGLAAGVPVLCVGNYHGGGAGKTPTVLALAKLLREMGETPVVLSRGYRGKLRGPVRVDSAKHSATDVGDEPLMLSQSVPVVVSRERAAGVALTKSLAATVILMDDGFQNPAVAKDASLIVIDSVRGIGNAQVMPSGPLRARFRPDEASLAALRGKRTLAFAGIGDPARFFATLRGSGIDVADARSFPDHHPLTPDETACLVAEAESGGLTLVSTEKDLARLRSPEGLPDWARTIVPFKVTLAFDDAAALRTFVSTQLFKARERRARL